MSRASNHGIEGKAFRSNTIKMNWQTKWPLGKKKKKEKRQLTSLQACSFTTKLHTPKHQLKTSPKKHRWSGGSSRQLTWNPPGIEPRSQIETFSTVTITRPAVIYVMYLARKLAQEDKLQMAVYPLTVTA